MINEDNLLEDVEKLLNENQDLVDAEDDELETQNNVSIKEKTNEIRNQRKKDSIIINRHLGYKRKYLKENKWIKGIFYLLLIAICIVCVCYLMPYKG